MNYQSPIPESGREQPQEATSQAMKDKLTPKAIVAALDRVGDDEAAGDTSVWLIDFEGGWLAGEDGRQALAWLQP